MNALNMVAYWLVIIGGLNWGLIGLGQLIGGGGWDIVYMLLGSWPVLAAIVYLLVGLSALWMLVKKMGMMGSSSMNSGNGGM